MGCIFGAILFYFMKYLHFVLHFVLFVAVGFLFYDRFSSSGNNSAASQTGSETPLETIVIQGDTANAYGAVAFVNTDTLLEKFESFRKMRASLEKRSSMVESELGGRMQALEKEYMEVQKKIQSGVMTETLIKDAEQSLMRKQQDLSQLRDQKTGQLVEEERNLTKKLNDQIFDYMQEYAPRHGLKYVLGYTRGGGILYAADSLDITNSVLNGLNAKYKGK